MVKPGSHCQSSVSRRFGQLQESASLESTPIGPNQFFTRDFEFSAKTCICSLPSQYQPATAFEIQVWAKMVKYGPSTASEKIIVVMGATGTGKSSFVRLVTGDPNVKVGHSLVSGDAMDSLLCCD